MKRLEHRLKPVSSEAGFSLIEVIVAMMLLAGIALLTAPFFALSLGQTASTTGQTSATAAVGKVIEQIRSGPKTCPLDTSTRGPYYDAKHRPWFNVVVQAPTCASETAVLVTATAQRISDGKEMSTASTRIYLP